ncbi:MAG: hypothetical protein O3B47_00525 [bacterium]|nr:hypothetical protein [bacterium]
MAGPPDGAEKAKPPVKPVAKPKSKSTVDRRNLAEEFIEAEKPSSGDRATEVAEKLMEDREKEEYLFEITDFNRRFDKLKAHFAKLEELKPNEKKEFVLEARRSLIELKFLLWYARIELQIEEVEKGGVKHEICKPKEGVEIDLTEKEAELIDIEKRVSEVKDEKDSSYYENLERQRDTISPRDFLNLSIEDRLILVSNIKSWDELKDGALLVFDFGSNLRLEYQIGLADLTPPQYRSMSVGGIVYKRKGNQGFYSEGNYLAIFNGSRVVVGEKNENYSAEKEYSEKFGDSYKESDENIDGPDGKRKLTRKDILSVARDFGVDAHFLEAVLVVVKGDPSNDISDDYEFLHISARYIQNAESKFEARNGAFSKDKHYTGEFEAYALDRFNLFAEHTGASDADIQKVIEKYAVLTGAEIKFDKSVKESRTRHKPKSRAEIQQLKNPGSYQGEVRYEQREIAAPTQDILRRTEARIAALKAHYDALVAKGDIMPEYRDRIMQIARNIYANMNARMGTWYHSTVYIKRPGKKDWGIKNSCVGAAMKAFEDSGLRLQRGRQGGKPAENFYWGAYRDGSRDFKGGFNWLRSMVLDDSQMVTVRRINPSNCDSLVGQYLEVGECAPAGLHNHALWLYKDVNGRIMMYHSGADVRPKRISLAAGDEVPPGYERRGNDAYKMSHRTSSGKTSSSKVNEIPFSLYLARKPDCTFVKFVPLKNLMRVNFPNLDNPAVA